MVATILAGRRSIRDGSVKGKGNFKPPVLEPEEELATE